MDLNNAPTWIHFPKYPIFPDHDGYPAWTCKQDCLKEAYIADYVWREFATNPELIQNVLFSLFPNAQNREDRIFLYPHNDQITVSLKPESCGCYTAQVGPAACRLGNAKDRAACISKQEELSCKAGFTMEGLFAQQFGWKNGVVARNLVSRQLVKCPTLKERQFFSKKTLHEPVLMAESDLAGVTQAAREAFPVCFDYFPASFYPYFTEDGQIACYKVYYSNSSGEETFLIFSKYQGKYGTCHFDSINWPWAKLPYNWVMKSSTPANENIFIICTRENMVQDIYEHDQFLAHLVGILSYANIWDTDWFELQGKLLYIVPENSLGGYIEALKLGSFLAAHISKNQLFVPREEALALEDNIRRYACSQDATKQVNFAGFCLHAKNKYGIEPPAGILPIAESLFSEKYKEVPHPQEIIPGILDEGDCLMLHAYRGVGKSLFAIFVALNLALGKSAWGGKILPKKRYSILLLDAEMSREGVCTRAKKVAKAHGLEISDALQLKVIYFRDRPISDNLENEEFLKILAPDLEESNLVIVDGAFRLLPSCMSPNFDDSAPLQAFVEYIRKLGKTLLIIDHQGKSKGDSFGSMGKELKLDGVLKMSQKGNKISIEISKMRDKRSGIVWAAYVLDATPERIKFHLLDEKYDHDEGEHEDKSRKGRVLKEVRAEVVAEYCQKFPDHSQKDLCQKIMAGHPECGARSSISKAIKDYRDNAA